MSETGTVLWNELSTTDPEAARRFYAAVLGWAYEEMAGPDGPYTICRAGDAMAGGLMKTPAPEIPSKWVPYFQVADVDATARAIEQAGGRILFPAMDVENVGRMVWAADPTGATIAFMTPFAMPDG